MSEVNGTWGTAEAVPGTVALNTGVGAGTTAVSCSSPGNCVAAGYYTYRYAKTALGVAGFVANQVNGTWAKARPVPALTRAAHFAEVTTVSCAPARTAPARKGGLNCVAAGVSQRRHSQAFVANEVDGTWRKAQQVPGTATLNAGGDASVTSLSCPVAGACVAAGTYKPKAGPDQIFVVNESAGRWKRAVQLPGSGKLVTHNGSNVGEVSCASATTCEVGGTLQTGASSTRGVLAGQTSGRWGKLSVVPAGIGSTITALSCPAPGYCAAGGQAINSSSASFPASTIVIDEAAGRWGKTVSLAGGYIGAADTESVYAVSCAAPRSCGAGGNLGGGKGRPYAVVANETPVK